MKKLIITSILALLVTAGTTIMAQDQTKEYLGLPGDNLNLYAVMKLFQESQTLESFEKSLNDENTKINNLDLNNDGFVDYITVADHVDGDVHTIVMQDALNQNEKQDVAVFTVQRFQNGSVQIQLVGDEALYGKNYIIEPIYDNNTGETPNPGYTGNAGITENNNVVTTSPYEIADWPLIRFMYLPDYSIWNSSWYWGYYPSYWHRWSPFSWDYYYGYQYNMYPDYYRHYRHWQYPRYERYNDFYYSRIRSHSQEVNDRIRGGNYKSTYSHPEQRRDGEALYSKTFPGQNSRRQDNNNNRVNNQGNRSVSQPNQGQTSGNSNSGNARRSNRTVTDRSGTNSFSGQNDRISRRASPAPSEKAVSRPESGQKREVVRTSRQSTPNAGSASRRSERSVKAGNSGKRGGIFRRSKSDKSSRNK